MRIRKKSWANTELDECPYFDRNPEGLRGLWASRFPVPQPLHLEIGCGRGVSTAKMAWAQKGVNLIAVDMISFMLGYARRNIEREFAGEAVSNVVLSPMDAMFMGRYFSPADRVERIYINFCNPWDEKARHEKRRLTHPRQLMQYREFLAPGGEIWFKTDSDVLFDASLGYFAECGFEERYLTRDLHASGFAPNFESEHEKMYMSRGVPIKFAIVRLVEISHEGDNR